MIDHSEDERTIPEKIRFVRDLRGLSQEEFARQLGVSFPTVNAWERGRSQPYPRHRKSIDELYKDTLADDRSRTVMIVEDDPSSAIVLQEYVALALPEWSTRIMLNGYDAMIQLGVLRPRLVLLDIMMPEIDGFKVLDRIRNMEEMADTLVIFVTAATDERVLARVAESGSYGLMQKPLVRDEVFGLLKAAATESLGY
ncbi:MAG TPA: hypothetical protein DCR55_15950 [Lentisphaeria bacterium]|nr:hypothetical protein [Lentisphaeria bacterium]